MSEKNVKMRKPVTKGQVICLVIALVIMVFSIIQVVTLTKYTIGKEVNISSLWLYKWAINIGK